MCQSTDTQGRILYAGARRVQKRELDGIHGVYVHITCGMKPHPPTDITSAALSVSDCGCYALVVLTSCHLGAMHVHSP